jgi:hypothetical protein
MGELPEISARFRTQRGVITRRQARDLGLTCASIDRRLSSGRWEVVHPTVYRLVGVPRTWHQDALAATLWLDVDAPALVSHLSALHLWGIDTGLARPAIEVTVPSANRRRSSRVRVHRTRHLPPHHVTERLGISVTSVERTLVDCAGRLGRGRLENAVEDALRLRLTPVAKLDAVVDEFGGRRTRGVGVLRAVLDQRRPGGDAAADRDLELATWRLISASGLPLPIRQHVVVVDGIAWSVDFYWPEHRVGLETDGYGAHQSLSAFRQDRLKFRALTAAGCRILPATWDDVTRRPDALLDDLSRALRLAA